jgi:hypothetical protein
MLKGRHWQLACQCISPTRNIRRVPLAAWLPVLPVWSNLHVPKPNEPTRILAITSQSIYNRDEAKFAIFYLSPIGKKTNQSPERKRGVIPAWPQPPMYEMD